jgi:hypothetical protein
LILNSKQEFCNFFHYFSIIQKSNLKFHLQLSVNKIQLCSNYR